MLILSCIAALAWLALLVLPWQPWRNRELLAARHDLHPELGDISVLIPARNEAALLPVTVAAAQQGAMLELVVVDDASSDGTADVARDAACKADFRHHRVVQAPPLPAGWSGKVWAQNTGLHSIQRPLVLLLDADIVLSPGVIASARARLLDEDLDLVSVMARLRMDSLWEKLLIPPFIYFFKLIYPFSLSNRRDSRVAAAAGGFILLRRSALTRIGGLHSLKDALIDDCTLARLVKQSGGACWTGQSLDVRSTRAYERLGSIWQMVSRTAFTQLHHSVPLLLLTTAAMLLVFTVPLLALASLQAPVWMAGGIALLAMWLSFTPCILLYGLHPGWILTLPAAAVLLLVMTWHSAWSWWRGEAAIWRGRRYSSGGRAQPASQRARAGRAHE